MADGTLLQKIYHSETGYSFGDSLFFRAFIIIIMVLYMNFAFFESQQAVFHICFMMMTTDQGVHPYLATSIKEAGKEPQLSFSGH
jgi:hypothetical protein